MEQTRRWAGADTFFCGEAAVDIISQAFKSQEKAQLNLIGVWSGIKIISSPLCGPNQVLVYDGDGNLLDSFDLEGGE